MKRTSLISHLHHSVIPGIVEPVRGGTDRWDRAGGVGRQQQDEFYTDEDNIERKKMLIEVEETTEEKAKREVRGFHATRHNRNEQPKSTLSSHA